MRCRTKKHTFRRREMASITTGFLSSPIRTIPSALELRQVMLFSIRERLADYTADQELGNAASLTLPRRQNSIQLAILILACCSRKKQTLFPSFQGCCILAFCRLRRREEERGHLALRQRAAPSALLLFPTMQQLCSSFLLRRDDRMYYNMLYN